MQYSSIFFTQNMENLNIILTLAKLFSTNLTMLPLSVVTFQKHVDHLKITFLFSHYETGRQM